MNQPPGTVIIVSGEYLRHAVAMHAIMELQMPPGSRRIWMRGMNVAENINQAIRKMEGEWAFIMGDDHDFKPDLLMKLLAHNVDVVIPKVCKRHYSWNLVAYRREASQMPGFWVPTGYGDLPPTGLGQIAAGSNAGMVVRKYVLDAMKDPWFEVGQEGSTASLSEDIHFYRKARALGFKCYVDMDAKLGHQTSMTVWPMDGNQVGVELEVSPGISIPVKFEKEDFNYPDGTPISDEDMRWVV